MAINSTLGYVRGVVKAEAAKSLQTSSTAQDPEINQIIYDVQQWQASDYSWPHLRDRWNVNVGQGTRYVTFPTADVQGNNSSIDINRLGDIKVFVKWNSIWQPVEYGIDEIAEFNYLDSDTGQQLDPIQRWLLNTIPSQLAGTPDAVQFEIWPLPAGAQLLRFVGQKTLTELRNLPLATPVTWNDAATLDLDDQLVAYFVVAEYIARQKGVQNAQSQYYFSLAKDRVNQIRRTYPRSEVPCIIGGTSTLDKKALRLVPLVVVAGGKTH